MGKGGKRSTTWKPTWNSGKTKVIRVPEAIADELMKIAHHLDNGGQCLLQDKNQDIASDKVEEKKEYVTDNRIKNSLKEILEKIEKKEAGYKTNSFGQGIKKLKELSYWLKTD
jgi:RNA polymerase-binding transcription factor DksA